VESLYTEEFRLEESIRLVESIFLFIFFVVLCG
jgi:hypothetical protein